MPHMNEAEAEALPVLKQRIKMLLKSRPRDMLIDQALPLIEEGAEAGVCIPYTTQGEKSPREIAGQALRRLLDQNLGWKQVNIDRWRYATDKLIGTSNGDVPVGASSHTLTSVSVPVKSSATLLDKVIASEAEDAVLPAAAAKSVTSAVTSTDDADVLQAAEEMLRAAEAERDSERLMAEDRLAAILRMQDEAVALTTARDEALKLAEDRKATADEVVGKLHEEINKLRAQLAKRNPPDPAAGLREAYFNALIDNVGKADPNALLDRLDKLVGIKEA